MTASPTRIPTHLTAGWPGRLKRAATEANPTARFTSSGDRVRDVAARFEGEATARHPDLIMFAVATADSPSDVAAATSIDAFRDSYRSSLRARGHSRRQERVPCVDVFGALSETDFDDDGLHPNPARHKEIFERVRFAIGAP